MTVRAPRIACLAIVALTALQVVLVYTAGEARYEFVQVLGLTAVAIALARLVAGSYGAWGFLVFINALPLAMALIVALTDSTTMAPGLIVLVATSAPLMALLLSPSVRHHVRARHAGRPLPGATSSPSA